MKVRELIKLLEGQNRDLPVYVWDEHCINPMEVTKVEFCNYQFNKKKYIHETVEAHQVKMVLIT